MKHIGVVGLGPHARRIYWPLLHHYDIHVPLVVDKLPQQPVIDTFLSSQSLQPWSTFYLHPDQHFHPHLASTLANLKHAGKLDGIILSTEPRFRMPYLKFCVNNNIHVLMDKPISAVPNASNHPHAAEQLLKDFDQIHNLLDSKPFVKRPNLFVQTQRRVHQGYQFVFDTIEDCVSRFRVPVSFIDIYHGDGMWPSLDEMKHRENHPYKFGYGKLLHSGYHFIDLLQQLIDINNRHCEQIQTMVVRGSATRKNDFFNQFRSHKVSEFPLADAQNNYRDDYGELDAFLQFQFFSSKGLQTTCALSLLQNSFSTRSSFQVSDDMYKGVGRVRHERLVVNIGPLLSVHVHSYQADGKDAEAAKLCDPPFGVGHPHHFEVLVFRNSALVGGSAFERFSFGEHWSTQSTFHFYGHNEAAREVLFRKFLIGDSHKLEFSSHRRSVVLLMCALKSISLNYGGSESEFPFTDKTPKVFVIAFDGVNRCGKGMQCELLAHKLELRGIPCVVIRGHGTRSASGSSLGDPKSKFWSDMAAREMHSSFVEEDWHLCARRLARELICWKKRWLPRIMRIEKKPFGVLIVDRSLISRAMFCKAMCLEVTSGDFYNVTATNIHCKDLLPDALFLFDVEENELLKRAEADVDEKKANFRKKLISTTRRIYLDVLSQVPQYIRQRVSLLKNDGSKSAEDIHQIVLQNAVITRILSTITT
jgi:thymidylate kinase